MKLWEMFYWETLGLAIHVDVSLTCAIYLNIIADKVLFVWERFKGHDEVFKVFP